jgi:hypothetical protein
MKACFKGYLMSHLGNRLIKGLSLEIVIIGDGVWIN